MQALSQLWVHLFFWYSYAVMDLGIICTTDMQDNEYHHQFFLSFHFSDGPLICILSLSALLVTLYFQRIQRLTVLIATMMIRLFECDVKT